MKLKVSVSLKKHKVKYSQSFFFSSVMLSMIFSSLFLQLVSIESSVSIIRTARPRDWRAFRRAQCLTSRCCACLHCSYRFERFGKLSSLHTRPFRRWRGRRPRCSPHLSHTFASSSAYRAYHCISYREAANLRGHSKLQTSRRARHSFRTVGS